MTVLVTPLTLEFICESPSQGKKKEKSNLLLAVNVQLFLFVFRKHQVAVSMRYQAASGKLSAIK